MPERSDPMYPTSSTTIFTGMRWTILTKLSVALSGGSSEKSRPLAGEMLSTWPLITTPTDGERRLRDSPRSACTKRLDFSIAWRTNARAAGLSPFKSLLLFRRNTWNWLLPGRSRNLLLRGSLLTTDHGVCSLPVLRPAPPRFCPRPCAVTMRSRGPLVDFRKTSICIVRAMKVMTDTQSAAAIPTRAPASARPNSLRRGRVRISSRLRNR